MSAFLTSAYTVVSASANLVIGTKQMTDKARRFFDADNTYSSSSQKYSKEVMRKVFALQTRFDCLLLPLNELLLWSVDKDSAVHNILINAMSLVQTVALFLNERWDLHGSEGLDSGDEMGGTEMGGGKTEMGKTDHLGKQGGGGPLGGGQGLLASPRGGGAGHGTSGAAEDVMENLDFYLRELDFAAQSVTMALTMIKRTDTTPAPSPSMAATAAGPPHKHSELRSSRGGFFGLGAGGGTSTGTTTSSSSAAGGAAGAAAGAAVGAADEMLSLNAVKPISPSALVKASRRIQEVAAVAGGGELCVAMGNMSVNGEAPYPARMKILMQNKCFQLRIDPIGTGGGLVFEAGAAPAARSVQFPISVALNFELSVVGPVPAANGQQPNAANPNTSVLEKQVALSFSESGLSSVTSEPGSSNLLAPQLSAASFDDETGFELLEKTNRISIGANNMRTDYRFGFDYTNQLTPIEFFYTARLCTTADPTSGYHRSSAVAMSPGGAPARGSSSTTQARDVLNPCFRGVRLPFLSLPDECLVQLLQTKALIKGPPAASPTSSTAGGKDDGVEKDHYGATHQPARDEQLLAGASRTSWGSHTSRSPDKQALVPAPGGPVPVAGAGAEDGKIRRDGGGGGGPADNHVLEEFATEDEFEIEDAMAAGAAATAGGSSAATNQTASGGDENEDEQDDNRFLDASELTVRSKEDEQTLSGSCASSGSASSAPGLDAVAGAAGTSSSFSKGKGETKTKVLKPVKSIEVPSSAQMWD
mmetsp:Transcript_13963/g.34510  ORF Transcript_13963/g.34510 Transcript_13963/m.34510 type:complete len:760 (+) Transcript_13963:292-2571(+)|eukprot:CAMPEP_0179002572 /NCGR_PEP_ID=MMETSP0795-20121207/12116_1 /TAXON_ID=88552 /ORGANISM="Amoebophrya sp., Strain Ameob2" /LENGTH=759 /DNA_ID=CAMNT_0020696323 /DNA_START=278 /DNA_END=2557 /DNA_ORIENTATION=+